MSRRNRNVDGRAPDERVPGCFKESEDRPLINPAAILAVAVPLVAVAYGEVVLMDGYTDEESFGKPSEMIMGSGLMPPERLAAFLLENNPGADPERVRMLARMYVEECTLEGVNWDVAFVQMCHETGFLRFGGLVTESMNNFCGLGAIGPEEPGLSFPDAGTGVRADVQHLKAYGSREPLVEAQVDPGSAASLPGGNPRTSEGSPEPGPPTPVTASGWQNFWKGSTTCNP